MSRLRNRETPLCGAIIALIVLASAASVPCWGAAGLEDLAGPLRALAVSGERGALPQMGPAAVGPPGSVLVVVEFRSEVAAVQPLSAFGAQVRFRHDRRVEAFVPVDALLEIARLPEVAQVRPPTYPIPMQGYGATSSEGVQLVGAVPFHTAGLLGQGISIAIIDLGFAGFDSAEIPIVADDPDSVVSFRADGTMGTSYHGTAVAEVAADMAPGADIILIAVDTAMSVESAIEYVSNRGIEVCCMAMGLFEGPYDGTHAVSRKVDRARDRGVFWVNAAGNSAQQHYQGAWMDRDRDQLHEFSAGDEGIDVTLTAGTYQAYLSWYQTAGSLTNRDYDLVLLDSSGNEVTRSGYTQNGDDPPSDTLVATISQDGVYTLQIEYVSGPAEHDDFFQLFSPNVDIETTHRVPESSMPIPAEARGAYTIGATRGAIVSDPAAPMVPIDGLEPFSSRGPVVGHPERIKPDLVAPDGVSTSLVDEGFSPFLGTSAAAPHVAGAAALLLSEDQLRTPEELETVLRSQALRLGDPVPNNEFGWGRLRMRVGADSRKPTITIAYPQNGTTITTRTPTVIAFIQDEGSGVDGTTIRVEFDGVEVFNGGDVDDIAEFYDSRTGQFAWPADDVLARTNHTVVLRVADNAGNEADPAVTNFRIAAPTIPGGVSMVSFPYTDLQVTDPSVILGTPLSDLALVRWWPLDETYDKYHFYPDARASLVPPDAQQANTADRTVPYPPAGLGYWLSIPRDAVLDIQGQPLRDVPSAHIRLFRGQQPPRGWNLIGNPYDEDVSWGSVQFVTKGVRQDLREAIASGVTEGVLFQYVQGRDGRSGYYDFAPNPNQAILEAGKGYWLHVNEDTRVVVYSSNIGAMVREDETVQAQSDDGWLLTLSARAGAYQDPRNVIGVKSDASAGYDPQWDVPEPPPIVDGVRLSMSRPGWGEHSGQYARDVRGAGGEAQWDIDVSCAVPDAEVEITWPELNAEVPGNVRLILEDLDTGERVYMRTTSSYRFRAEADGGVRHLRVTEVGGGEALAVNSMAARQTGAGGAMITYSVAKPADVTVEVMNIAGRLVKRFAAQTVESGTQQTLVWNGVSDRGSAVPSGRYIVRLTALAADGQTVQAIRPFSIAR
ncbi:MAG: S8 family serine peptidase [Armatimonadota bacterium]